MLDSERIGRLAAPLLNDGEAPRVIFMGANFDATMRDGGSTRIVVVTDTAVVALVTGLLRRTEPRRVDQRWHPLMLRTPEEVWPGRTLIGEEWGEALPGLWVHRRYEPEVRKAHELASWLYR